MQRYGCLVSAALAATAAALAIGGCGQGGGGGGQPTPTPVTTYTVAAAVFLDDNGNGVQDANEPAVVPYVQIDVGGHTGTSAETTGIVSITGVPAGTYDVTFKKLPPFYQAGAAVKVTVPQSGSLLIPLTLSIGDNIPGTYLAEGDSITKGDPGSTDDMGYRSILQTKLHTAYARAQGPGDIAYNRSTEGGYSEDGAHRIELDMRRIHAAFTMIDWGVNDWNPDPQNHPDEIECQADPSPPACPLIDNLGFIMDTIKAAHSLPVLATLTPPNPTGIDPPQRHDWVLKANDLIRQLAKDKQALLVDIGDAFEKKNDPGLYFDHIHPNDNGYALMAETFFAALTQGTVSTQDAAPPVLLPLAAR